MSLRSIIFWPHLVAGVLAGTIILIMSVTGVLLTYEKQMLAWADRETSVPAAGRSRLSPEDLLTLVEAHAGAMPTVVVVPSAADAPVLATVHERTLLIDPYSGAVLGPSAPRLRRFFRVVTDCHRWLAASATNRTRARAVTGWANFIFLFIVGSGLYLWIPRRWTWRHVSAVAWFKGRLSGRARDFNWHNVIGIWCAVPLLLVVISAMPISFPWANALLYRAVGEPPPPGPRRAAPRPTVPSAAATTDSDDNGNDAGGSTLAGINDAWERARRQVDGWRTISLRVPASAHAPLTFTIDRGTGGQPQHRGTLTVPRDHGAAARWEPFQSQSPGRRLRSISRFLHTGEVLGLAGQTMAGIASFGGAVLVWTGMALAYRRFFTRARAATERERSAA